MKLLFLFVVKVVAVPQSAIDVAQDANKANWTPVRLLEAARFKSKVQMTLVSGFLVMAGLAVTTCGSAHPERVVPPAGGAAYMNLKSVDRSNKLIGRVILEAPMLTTRAAARTFQTTKCVNRLRPFGAGGALSGVGARFCVAVCVLFCAGPALAFEQDEVPTSCNRLILVEDPPVPVMDSGMTFSNATDIANRFGRRSTEVTLASEFWTGAPTSGPCVNAKLLFSRGRIETARPHLFSGNLASLCNGKNCGLLNSCAPCAFYITANGHPYNASVNFSSAATASDVAETLQSAIANAETVVGNVTGSISPQLVKVTSAVVGGSWIEVLSVSSGVIQPGGFVCVSSNPCKQSSSDFVGQITAQLSMAIITRSARPQRRKLAPWAEPALMCFLSHLKLVHTRRGRQLRPTDSLEFRR